MLPLEVTAVIGSIGGIAEIAREAFAPADGSDAPRRRTAVPRTGS